MRENGENMKKIIIAAVSFCVLAAAGVVLFFVLRSKTGKAGITVTLKKTQIDITKDVADVISAVDDEGYYVMEFRKLIRLKATKSGKIKLSDDKLSVSELSSGEHRLFGVAGGPTSLEHDDDDFGYITYVFDDTHLKCKGLSLLPDWNGKISKLDNYLDDENSFDNGKLLVAFFKNGKIVKLDDIFDEYETDDQSLRDTDAFKNLISVFMQDKNSSLIEDCYTYTAALNDWWDQYMDGEIHDFGWLVSNNIQLTICVAKPYSEVKKVLRPE